jgi:hypothetical protein
MRKNGYEKYIEIVYDIIKEWENKYWDHAYPEKVWDRVHSVYDDGEPVVVVYGITGKIWTSSPQKKNIWDYLLSVRSTRSYKPAQA